VTLHLAPNAPWILLALLVLALLALSLWAYRFAIPPLPDWARRLLPALRIVALALIVALLAQPVLERPRSGSPQLAVLVDRSLSMQLPVAPGGEPRAEAARRAVAEIERAWRGRARVTVLPFASRVGADSAHVGDAATTAIGDALGALAEEAGAESVSAAVVVSDGASNMGSDPVAAARRLGVPVHTVRVGETRAADRAIVDVAAPRAAQAGRPVSVRVHLTTAEERGTPIGVSLRAEGRELARTTAVSPGPGAEAVAELRATPLRPGLAVWTASLDTLKGELTTRNDSKQVAFPVSPGRIGVTLVTGGLNWDFTFLRRALTADSSLEIRTWARDRNGWRSLEGRRGSGPSAADLHESAVVLLDGLTPTEAGGPAFDAALTSFVERGGGLLVLGGGAPGLARLRGGRLGAALGIEVGAAPALRSVSPVPAPEARDLLSWDDDPARGEQAWRTAAPLSDVASLSAGAGDRVLVRGAAGGVPLLVARRVGRGQALLVNGAGFWRWALSGSDELTAERGRKLWRGLVHWLAEPVQAEPLRVRPERWLTAGGEPVRLIATLQDAAFAPVAGAAVEAEVTGERGATRRLRFTPGAGGSYTAALDALPPGRYRVSASAAKGGKTLGRSSTEFAVDRWSLEESRALPDSGTLAAVAEASGGRAGSAADVAAWSRGLAIMGRSRGPSTSVRLWESPWVFALIVGALSLEWAWRRRRGLP
jgi:hypothetical protein